MTAKPFHLRVSSSKLSKTANAKHSYTKTRCKRLTLETNLYSLLNCSICRGVQRRRSFWKTSDENIQENVNKLTNFVTVSRTDTLYAIQETKLTHICDTVRRNSHYQNFLALLFEFDKLVYDGEPESIIYVHGRTWRSWPKTDCIV
jgi:hypothetical protein